MPENMENQLRESASSPRRASGDSGSMEQHSLKDQIELDRYLESKKAVRKKNLGIRITKLEPPGAV